MSTTTSFMLLRRFSANRFGAGQRHITRIAAATTTAVVPSARECCHRQQQQQLHPWASSSSSLARFQPSLRTYVSRAHPKPIPEFPIGQALNMVLEGVEERKEHRAARWERRKTDGKTTTTQQPASAPGELYRNMDETIEMSINLNVDPRKPGQAIRGSLVLPHGTGKKQVKCLVFTKDSELARKAAGSDSSSGASEISTSSDGSILAGGEALIDQILSGDVAVDTYERALCTKDILPQLQKQLARLLGPRGLMPNVKTNTVFDNITASSTAGGENGDDQLLRTLREQSSTVTYRTDPNGILHFVVGKGSFEPQKLMENMQAICQTVQEVKPESYGKGKKKGGGGSKGGVGKNVKYWLKAHLSSTQAKGSVRLDLRTVDPTSPFFMKEPE